MSQKTWTELIGEYQNGDYVNGRYWVRPIKGTMVVLWMFDTEKQAKEAFHYWVLGK